MTKEKLIETIKNTPIVAMVQGFQQLRINGMNDKEIENIIKSLNLPLRLHVFILGNFTDLMSLKIK